jgi:tRNA dimethylallyltransferase
MGPSARPARTPPPLAAIVGPTASGKSALALALADRLPIEILVADSRQVYRGMDVGTAKPSAADRARVPHHLLDLVAPDAMFTVADWVQRAREVVRDVAQRGRLPLVVGGTGLYVSALVDGFAFERQPWSPELRRRLAAELETDGLAALVTRLAKLDPPTADRIDRANPRRVLRALERAELTGGPAAPTAEAYPGRLALLGLARPREVLARRIDARAAALFDEGLLDEARRLQAAGYGPALGPMTGHGYREAARLLAGDWSRDEAVAITARRTRQYAKRQLTWFRRDLRIAWIPAGELPADDPRIVARAAELLRALLG